MSETTEISAEEITETTVELSRKQTAGKLTNRFILWSMGGSIIPIAFVDLVAVIAVQIKLISEISKIYGLSFEKNRIKGIITPLIGSIGLAPTCTAIVGSLLKIIPGVGSYVCIASLPIVIGAITYATGRIFIAHFESGGTLLSFNADEAKEAYKQHFKEGQEVAKNLKETEAETTSASKAAPKK